MTQLLTDVKLYSKEDNVKCLVWSNDSTMTYVFLIYANKAIWINVFDNDLKQDEIDFKIIGYGMMENRVKNFLLYFDTDIKIFSLLREQEYKILAKNYLEDIEKNCLQRKKIQEANFDSVINKLEGDDERKILDMLRSFHDNNGIYIQSHQNDLISLMNSRGGKAFEDIIDGIIKKLVDLPIQDNMIYEVFREDVEENGDLNYKPSDMGMIAWSLNTKLKRLNILKNFLNDSDIDYNLTISRAEESVVFMISIKRNHDEICRLDNSYQSIEILNQAIQEIVKNVHKISREEIKQKGTTSSLIFYSMPLKSSEKFIYTLSKIMYERKMKESLLEDTLIYLSMILLDGIESIQNHREIPRIDLNFTTNIVDPIKRVIELMPEIIRNNSSANLTRRMKQLSNALLTELKLAADVENQKESDEEMYQNFVFTRNKLVWILDEFSPELAIELAFDFKDVVNTTRLCIKLNAFNYLHDLFNSMDARTRRDSIQESMEWIFEDYKNRLKKADNNIGRFEERFGLFEIFEDR